MATSRSILPAASSFSRAEPSDPSAASVPSSGATPNHRVSCLTSLACVSVWPTWLEATGPLTETTNLLPSSEPDTWPVTCTVDESPTRLSGSSTATESGSVSA